MGNAKSAIFESMPADTVEEAALSLELVLEAEYHGACVKITSALDGKFLPYRATARLAFAEIGDGKSYTVTFHERGKLVVAKVNIPVRNRSISL